MEVGCLVDSEKALAVLGDAFRGPWRIPDQIHVDVFYVFHFGNSPFGLLGDVWAHATTLCSESHIYLNFAVFNGDVVDQTQVDDVYGNLWIVNIFEGFLNVFNC